MNIKLTKAGPVRILTSSEGAVLSFGEDGETHTINPNSSIWAYKCGHSSNYPHCDGSHNQPVITTTSEYPLLS